VTHHIPDHGTMIVTDTIDRRAYSDKFYVFKSLSQNVILGRPFLHHNQVVLDFSDKHRLTDVGFNLTCVQTEDIIPGESKLIRGKSANSINTGLHGWIGQHERRDGLLIHEITATAYHDEVPVLITNTTDRTIKLRSGKKIAAFTPLSSEQLSLNIHQTEPSQQTHVTHDHSRLTKDIRCVEATTQSQQLRANHDHSPKMNDIKSTQREHDEKVDHLLTEYNIDLKQCDPDIKRELVDVLTDNQRAFTDSSGRLGFCDWVPQEIHLKPHVTPFARQPYRLDPQTRDEIQKQIDKLLDNGVIRRQYSQWASPVIAIKKQAPKARKHMRDQNTKPEIRICVDYRYLNSNTIPVQAHIPNCRELFDDIARNKPKIYSTLDLQSGFHQQSLSEESKSLTGFIFNKSSYCYNSSPQGLNGSPYFFQRLMNRVLEEIPEDNRKFVSCYIDDLLLCSPTKEHHIRLLDDVLKAFTKANLTLCGKKCEFMKEKVTFLGHEVSAEGLTIPDKHAVAMATWPQPTSPRTLRAFLGCAQYFRFWLPDRGRLLQPLTRLTRKDAKFQWGENEKQAFEAIKQQLSSKPILRHPDFDLPFTIFSDASKDGIGACLCQRVDDHAPYYPVAFMGRATSPVEQRYSTTDLEALALTSAVSEWQHYLSGRQFTIYTDHKALTYIFQGSAKLSPKLARYAMFLSEFKFRIIHLKGTKNLIADALSRRMYTQSQPDHGDILPDYPTDQSAQIATTSIDVDVRDDEGG
jgi:hypothetical protein